MQASEIISSLVILIIYFIPAAVAHSRQHPSKSAIFALNLLLGWSGIGWLVALIWSYTGKARTGDDAPSPASHVKCPDCRELVIKDARKCRHCGCKLIPQ